MGNSKTVNANNKKNVEEGWARWMSSGEIQPPTHINKKRDTKYAMTKLSKTITGLKYRTINIIKLGKKNDKKTSTLL